MGRACVWLGREEWSLAAVREETSGFANPTGKVFESFATIPGLFPVIDSHDSVSYAASNSVNAAPSGTCGINFCE
jgi:hypothetical protein